MVGKTGRLICRVEEDGIVCDSLGVDFKGMPKGEILIIDNVRVCSKSGKQLLCFGGL